MVIFVLGWQLKSFAADFSRQLVSLNASLVEMEESFREGKWSQASIELDELRQKLSPLHSVIWEKAGAKKLKNFLLLMTSMEKAIARKSQVIAENRFRSLSGALLAILEEFPELKVDWVSYGINYIDQSISYFHQQKYYSSQQELTEILELIEKSKEYQRGKDPILSQLKQNIETAIALLAKKEYEQVKKLQLDIRQQLNQLRD